MIFRAINGPLECSAPGNPSAAARCMNYGATLIAFGINQTADCSGCA